MTNIFQSEFNNDILVYIALKEDPWYKAFNPLFEEYGFGFIMDGVCMINGGINLSEDILKWIEAHEVAHYILGHKEEKNPKDELDADTLSYEMLYEKGYYKSAELVKQKSIERHGHQI